MNFFQSVFCNQYAAISGKTAGKFLAFGISLVVFFTVRFLIGRKEWYDKTVEQYRGMTDGEQRRTIKKGGRYLFIASLPVIVFILWLLASLF